jgi:predicted permease
VHIFQPLLSSILVVALIAAIGLVARQAGFLKTEWSGNLSRIIFDLGIPAMIFVNLAGVNVDFSSLEGPAILVVVELSMIAAAWKIGAWAGLNGASLGAVVLCSAFGTSATLGYSIISIVFPNNPEAMLEAVLISELGVALLVFTLGPVLAMHFGSGGHTADIGRSIIAFFKTPIFIALAAGLLWSVLGLPAGENAILRPVFGAGQALAGLVVPLSILVIALNLKMPDLKRYLRPLAIVAALKLVAGPILAGTLAITFGLPEIWRDELIIMAGLPPAVLNVIYLQRYGGDAETASVITAGASLLSLATLLLVMALLG